MRSQAGAWERGERPAADLISPWSLGTRGESTLMTRTRYQIYETEYAYFITSTINGWLPVFTRRDAVNIIFESWKHLQQARELKLFAYVILDNHLHMVVSAPELPGVMQSFKSWTARKIIDLLKECGGGTLLRQFKAMKLNHKTQSEYQVWQEGGKPKQIQNDEMMWQKINYTHNNPLKRGFVDDAVHWRWSSARNYAGQIGLIDVVTDWR
jgi:REP-associated tyrosine transposase